MGNQNSERANYLDVDNWLNQTRLSVESYSNKTTFKGTQNPYVDVDETFTVGKLDDPLRKQLAELQPVTVISRFDVSLPSGASEEERELRKRVEDSFRLHQSDNPTHPIFDRNRSDGVEIELRFESDKRGKTTMTLDVSGVSGSLEFETEPIKLGWDNDNIDELRRQIVLELRKENEKLKNSRN